VNSRPSPKQRRPVETRAQGRCEYCQTPAFIAPQGFNVDHIIPLSRGGLTELENLAFACGCNLYKANQVTARDPQSRRVVALFNPRKHKWQMHFTWSLDRLCVEGKTASGRATVEALRLNRDELLNLRRLLMLIDQHPPDFSK